MHLARGLGFRYLWVDALCILQDNADERRRLIHGMGGIYGGAACTIICAAGANADSGLKGIWNTARQPLPFDEPVRLSGPRLKHFSVMVSKPSLDSEVRQSHWNTRGWTYQEVCLSSRSLYFTAGEVFFSCFFCHNREGYELRDGSPANLQIMAKSSPLWEGRHASLMASIVEKVHFHSLPSKPNYVNFAVYRTVVQDYTKRELTLSSDVINAFQGIFNRFIDPGKTYLTLVHEAQCIPPRFLHLALLWYPISGSARRCSAAQSTTPSKFSSWSWTSWHGPVTFIPANVTLGTGAVWNNDLASRDPKNAGCLIQASGLPQPSFPPSASSFSKMAATKILSLSSSAAGQLAEEIAQSRESSCPPVGIGVLELSVPVLLGSAVRLSSSPVPGWRTLSLCHAKRKDSPNGWFKLDQDSGTATSPHSYLAVAVSRNGTVGVVGVAENDDGPNERRTISREDLGFYHAVVVSAIYEFDNDLDITDPTSFYAPLAHCIVQHPFLSVLVMDRNTDKAYYQRAPHIDLSQHISILPPILDITDAAKHSAIQSLLASNLDRPFTHTIPPWRVLVTPLPRTPLKPSSCILTFSYSHSILDGPSGLSFNHTYDAEQGGGAGH
ncbi:heterokaryon incompatibility protein-domain-containing protein [Schizothecium vesticola]|uniref:Heterokaryon incompatibility protein-domain-containing protein n=1 Tax=Schizothecium vesticola TaxID=314040 RepID=A0AA40K9J8_9PEZI|nr:heterokaryon incompatibility protein-domain-containing protein [Schizothecium vesticola]